jgi:hypothetical protein
VKDPQLLTRWGGGFSRGSFTVLSPYRGIGGSG